MTTEIMVFGTTNLFDPEAMGAAVRKANPTLTVHVAKSNEAAQAQGGACEVLICAATAPLQLLVDAMPKLKWLHLLAAGTDVVDRTRFNARPAITFSRGTHGPQMAELVFLMILSAVRDFPRIQENQKNHIWDRWPQPVLAGKTMTIIGVGGIAEDLAARAKAFEMKVVGVSSRASAPGFDDIVPREKLGDALASADFVVILAPYNAANANMLSAEMLARMQKHAVLVNLGRGGLVDENALRDMLIAGKLAGAALDVFAREPLPKDDPLWDTPRLLVTPHIGGFSNVYTEQMLPLVLENLAAWRAGKPETMRNLLA
jgi:phosphoglycerate dehydrogenase-like enzyme